MQTTRSTSPEKKQERKKEKLRRSEKKIKDTNGGRKSKTNK